MHPAHACAESDGLILDEITAALMPVNDHGRTLYDEYPMHCPYFCSSFAPGTCWVVFRWCRGNIRALRGTLESHDESLEVNVNEFEVDHSIDCAKAILAAESTMEALAATIDNGECHSALMEKKIYQCFHLNEELE